MLYSDQYLALWSRCNVDSDRASVVRNYWGEIAIFPCFLHLVPSFVGSAHPLCILLYLFETRICYVYNSTGMGMSHENLAFNVDGLHRWSTECSFRCHGYSLIAHQQRNPGTTVSGPPRWPSVLTRAGRSLFFHYRGLLALAMHPSAQNPPSALARAASFGVCPIRSIALCTNTHWRVLNGGQM